MTSDERRMTMLFTNEKLVCVNTCCILTRKDMLKLLPKIFALHPALA